MTSRELLYVKTIANEKSISQAAKKLFISQPSLSQSLQRIEEMLGIKLFNRCSGRLTLTYIGERYYQIACQILKIYEDFESEISDVNDLKTGRIYMGITNHLGTIVLPQILPEFRQKCPYIELNIYEESTERQEARLLSGELGFAILHAPKKDTNPMLNYERLAYDPFVIAVPPGHPLIQKAKTIEGYTYPVLDLKLLKDESFIMLHKDQRIRHVTDSILGRAKVTPKIILSLKNYETAQSLAGKGIGITMIPNDYTNITCMESPPVFLSIEEKYSPGWDLSITTTNNGYLSRADQYFISLVRKCYLGIV